MNNKKYFNVCCLVLFMVITLCIENTITWDFQANAPTTCGRVKMGFGTVIRGTEVTRGEHPWVAVIIKTDGSVFCGGTLVSSKFVISAAHCFEGKDNTHSYKPRDILVILGAHDLKKAHEPGKVTASIINIYIHPDWHPNIASYDADIAMLEFEDEVTFSRYIQPACIASPQSRPAFKSEGVVVGYGKSENSDIEDVGRIVKTPIHSYADCLKSEDHQSMLSHRTFCGGLADGSGVCSGDSGSGLIVKYVNTFYLRGIVSASLYGALHGCNVDQYSVFSDITKLYNWVMTGNDNHHVISNIRRTTPVSRFRRPTTTMSTTSTMESDLFDIRMGWIQEETTEDVEPTTIEIDTEINTEED